VFQSRPKKLTYSLGISYQNAKGLRSKLPNLYSDSLSFASQVIVLTETWLKSEILSSEVFPAVFTVYRLDRRIRRGGGVLIAVDSSLTSELLTFKECNDVSTYLKINIPNKLFNT
ncbi:hypothetical protein KR200_007776, partial [Drosophila serrata]